MITSKPTFIGVCQTGPLLSYCMMAVDGGLHVLDKQEGDLETALTFCQGYDEALVGINFARQLNRGVLKSIPHSHGGRGRPATHEQNMRLCEAVLRRQGLKITTTPGVESQCPAGMLEGFVFYQRLQEAGFALQPVEEAPRQIFETYAEGVFRALLGQPLLALRSLEGRLQRQLLLYEQGLHIADPMNFFEEITRNRLMQGTLPWQTLCSLAELNALASAYMAWRILNRPQQISPVGDVEEGCLLLPYWKELESVRSALARQMAIFS